MKKYYVPVITNLKLDKICFLPMEKSLVSAQSVAAGSLEHMQTVFICKGISTNLCMDASGVNILTVGNDVFWPSILEVHMKKGQTEIEQHLIFHYFVTPNLVSLVVPSNENAKACLKTVKQSVINTANDMGAKTIHTIDSDSFYFTEVQNIGLAAARDVGMRKFALRK